MRVAIHTLGCKVNQYESQAMEELLRARGHSLVPFEAQADVYLINSCTVTATSDKKSRQAVRQARKRAPGALVALCGCYPQVSPEAARQLEADLIGGSGDRRGFLDLLEQLARTREKAVALDDPFRRRVFEPLPAGGLEGRTRAMLKVEPRTVTEDFCAQLAGLPNLCPHFHLSLQSGCDATLARMKRRYTTERYLESVELLRRHFDRPALTTDLIVGFPGETEEEFAQTLSFLQTCAFAQMHIFPYSRRQGTPAAGMPGQIPNGEKALRAHQGAELARAMEKSWLSSWMGQRVSVLFEEEKDGFWRGYTPQYIEVRGKGENLHNRVCPVTLTAVGEGVAFGVVTEEEAP